MKKKELSRRRRRLMETMGDSSIAIVPTSPVRVRNRDIDYVYRPDSDFHYLCGFEEPEAVAVLIPGRKQGEFLLFCREKDPVKEAWDGSRAGLEGACTVYAADDAFPISDMDDILPGLIEKPIEHLLRDGLRCRLRPTGDRMGEPGAGTRPRRNQSAGGVRGPGPHSARHAPREEPGRSANDAPGGGHQRGRTPACDGDVPARNVRVRSGGGASLRDDAARQPERRLPQYRGRRRERLRASLLTKPRGAQGRRPVADSMPAPSTSTTRRTSRAPFR